MMGKWRLKFKVCFWWGGCLMQHIFGWFLMVLNCTGDLPLTMDTRISISFNHIPSHICSDVRERHLKDGGLYVVLILPFCIYLCPFPKNQAGEFYDFTILTYLTSRKCIQVCHLQCEVDGIWLLHTSGTDWLRSNESSSAVSFLKRAVRENRISVEMHQEMQLPCCKLTSPL